MTCQHTAVQSGDGCVSTNCESNPTVRAVESVQGACVGTMRTLVSCCGSTGLKRQDRASAGPSAAMCAIHFLVSVYWACNFAARPLYVRHFRVCGERSMRKINFKSAFIHQQKERDRNSDFGILLWNACIQPMLPHPSGSDMRQRYEVMHAKVPSPAAPENILTQPKCILRSQESQTDVVREF